MKAFDLLNSSDEVIDQCLKVAKAKAAESAKTMGGTELDATEVAISWITALREAQDEGIITEEIYNKVQSRSAKITADFMARRYFAKNPKPTGVTVKW